MAFNWNKALARARNKQIAKNKKKERNKKIRILEKKICKLKNELAGKRQKHGFYDSKEWLELRFKVLAMHRKKFGYKCLVCNRMGVVLHVDHIKPRSKFPQLALDENNLQVLCKDCNLGKSNKDQTDFRTLSDEFCDFHQTGDCTCE